MFTSVHEGHRAIRQIVFDNHAPGDAFCFGLDETTDAGPGQRGELFEQSGDFFMLEVVVDAVRRAGPSQLSPRRVFGGVDLDFLTKDTLDDLGARARLEVIGNWFSSQTLAGIRFREFIPTDEGRLIGFRRYSATVPFEFELQPKGA